MPCNGGLHGALFRDYTGTWSCLLCNEEIDYEKLHKLRDEARRKIIEIEALPPSEEEIKKGSSHLRFGDLDEEM